ncbi:MAG: 3-isopropylmalate dehydratase small subunit [Pseudomonadota bacterium]
MEPFVSLTSRTVVLPAEDIDTDQIIPARFLTTTTRAGLGQHLFSEWRYLDDGTPDPSFTMNMRQSQGAQVLVAGHNFGCGSSREHAPWALYDFGIRVVISTQIADIFRSNAQKNGIVPILVNDEIHQWLLTHPDVAVTVDLESMTLRLPGARQVEFELDPFARHCLMQGVDQLGFLLAQTSDVDAFERDQPLTPAIAVAS